MSKITFCHSECAELKRVISIFPAERSHYGGNGCQKRLHITSSLGEVSIMTECLITLGLLERGRSLSPRFPRAGETEESHSVSVCEL